MQKPPVAVAEINVLELNADLNIILENSQETMSPAGTDAKVRRQSRNQALTAEMRTGDNHLATDRSEDEGPLSLLRDSDVDASPVK